MKNTLPFLLSLILLTGLASSATAQNSGLAKDQNPRFEESRTKYMESADSLNQFHSTTIQDTYKAIDYLVDRAESREQRRAFRRELRLERARNGWYDYNYYGDPYFNSGYFGNGYYNNGFYNGRYNNGRYNNGYYNGRSGYNRGGYYPGRYNNNTFLNSLPLAFTLAWLLN
ncbi:MAG: hypothetical protein EOO02_02335 [Chitinophagaceae bacterium]|nr:MAG: hypothetical protein EOO02_02335 [Chitinophagaceae bacterium]